MKRSDRTELDNLRLRRGGIPGLRSWNTLITLLGRLFARVDGDDQPWQKRRFPLEPYLDYDAGWYVHLHPGRMLVAFGQRDFGRVPWQMGSGVYDGDAPAPADPPLRLSLVGETGTDKTLWLRQDYEIGDPGERLAQAADITATPEGWEFVLRDLGDTPAVTSEGSTTEWVEWCDILWDGNRPYISETRLPFPMPFSRPGFGRNHRLIGQVRSDGSGGWEYQVSEGTIEETGSNNAIQVSQAWAASPATKTYVWVEISYSTSVVAGEWHQRMTGASIQTGAAWGVGGTGLRVVRLFAVKNNELTDVEWEGDYTWCEPLEKGADSVSFQCIKLSETPPSDTNCYLFELYDIAFEVDFGQRTITKTQDEGTGTTYEVKKCLESASNVEIGGTSVEIGGQGVEIDGD